MTKNRFKYLALIVFFLLASFLLQQCATMFEKNDYQIKVTTNPPNAKVMLKVGYTGQAGIITSPGTLKLDWYKIPIYEDNLFLEVTKEGYRTENLRFHKELHPIIFANIFTLGLGAIIDLSTGAAWRPIKTKYFIKMERNKKDKVNTICTTGK